MPCLIAAVPAGLVVLQPDLGSAIVFAGILFAMLYWAGVRVPLLILLASPIASLFLAFSAVDLGRAGCSSCASCSWSGARTCGRAWPCSAAIS